MREEIADFRQIDRYIEELTFKKQLVNGISIEDVYACIQDLNAMYRDCVLDAEEAYSMEVMELRKELEREKIRNQEYDEKSELLTNTITTLHKSSDVMLSQAEREADQIRAKAIKEVERIVEEQNERVNAQQMRAKRVLDELNAIKEQSAGNLNHIATDLSHLANKIAGLHDKMMDISDTPQKILSSETMNLKRARRYESDLAYGWGENRSY